MSLNSKITCFVPNCNNNKLKNTELYFVKVPRSQIRRIKWFKAVGVLKDPSTASNLICCEDHFDLENDSENWGYFNYYKKKLSVCRLKLKPNVVPHKKITTPKVEFVECKESYEMSSYNHTRIPDPLNVEFTSRMQKFRFKLKEDPEKLKNHLEKERERDKRRRNFKKLITDDNALNEKRRKDRERQRKYRENKRRCHNVI
nr:uncharacterized protein LOC111416313 [Onthophagus taurus]